MPPPDHSGDTADKVRPRRHRVPCLECGEPLPPSDTADGMTVCGACYAATLAGWQHSHVEASCGLPALAHDPAPDAPADEVDLMIDTQRPADG